MAKGCRLFLLFCGFTCKITGKGAFGDNGLIANELSLKGLFFVSVWISERCQLAKKGLM